MRFLSSTSSSPSCSPLCLCLSCRVRLLRLQSAIASSNSCRATPSSFLVRPSGLHVCCSPFVLCASLHSPQCTHTFPPPVVPRPTVSCPPSSPRACVPVSVPVSVLVSMCLRLSLSLSQSRPPSAYLCRLAWHHLIGVRPLLSTRDAIFAEYAKQLEAAQTQHQFRIHQVWAQAHWQRWN